MITKFKIFEVRWDTYQDSPLIEDLEIGDYVICYEQMELIRDFISNNVGQYVMDRGFDEKFRYLIKYENIPTSISDYLTDDGNKNCRRMASYEIVKWSKNKEELEAELAAKKYNL